MFTASYGISIGPIAWILPSEVFPLSMRSKGVALCTASNWLNNCMCPFFLRHLVNIHLFFLLSSFFLKSIVFIGLLTPVMFNFSASSVSSLITHFSNFKNFNLDY